MSKRLAPYGNEDYAGTVAAVGSKPKNSRLLRARAPSKDLMAKVGAPPPDVITSLRLVRLKSNG